MPTMRMRLLTTLEALSKDAHTLTSSRSILKLGMGVSQFSLPLRTGTCYIRDNLCWFLQSYCALQELLLKMKFTLAVAPPFLYTMASPSAMPTQSVWQYGFFSEPARWRQVAKYGNLKHHESWSFFGDIGSLEPSKF